MRYALHFLVAVLLTAFSYYSGSLIVTDEHFVWQSLVIGFTVVSMGALTEKLGAPIWLIVLMPFPIGMSLLFMFLGELVGVWPLHMPLRSRFITILHMFVSYLFHFHSLIPAWKLSKRTVKPV
ncbi:LOW QUALITY PROTEIN: hypothetical protein JCM19037_1105 [Geomicrobium sp. JCM 19037]|nr:LOW QUALITY PROTEIN: hypothetical protein JCM19037_1105 [Geomicrobium sp. JCM 19037]